MVAITDSEQDLAWDDKINQFESSCENASQLGNDDTSSDVT